MKEHKARVSSSLVVILLVLAACTVVAAQQTSGGLGGAFETPAGTKITNTIMDRIAQRNRQRKPDSSAKTIEASILFRPTGTQLKTREIAELIDAGNPQLLKLLTALLEEFDKGATEAGHPNDLALALSFFLATNASIYHGGSAPSDPAMMELRDTIAAALVEDNALSGVTDRQKQELYETLVLFTGFTLATYQEGNEGGNADTVKVSRQLAGQNLLAVVGISPDKISFTTQGLSIETDASAVTPTGAQSNTGPTPASTLSSSDFLDFDPFPDQPRHEPQTPLIGRLRKTMTVADLAGTWNNGAASVQRYIDSSTGDYAGTNTTFYGEEYVIRPDGTFDYLFVGRSDNRTVREKESGTIILSGGFITVKFNQRTSHKYQFLAFMTQPSGAAILSLVEVHDTFQGYDAAGMQLECGHPKGYVQCVGGEEWARLGDKPTGVGGFTQPSQSAVPNQDTAAETINAGKLVIDFEGNEVRALQMYGGKRIRVNGTVNSIDVQKNGLIVLTFHSPAGGYAQTQCYFNKSQSSGLAQLSGGQQAVVEGTVKGIGGGLGGRGFVVLEDCVVP